MSGLLPIFFALATANFVVNRPLNASGLTGLEIPAWQWIHQDAHLFSHLVGKNVSFLWNVRGHGCSEAETVISGTAQPGELKALHIFGWNSPCDEGGRIRTWKDKFHFLVNNIPDYTLDLDVGAWRAYEYEQGDPSYVHIGLPGASDQITVAESLASPTFPVLVGVVFEGRNVSAQYDGSWTISGFQRQMRVQGSFLSFTMHGGAAFGILIMVVSAFKLAQFILARGKIEFSIVQIDIAVIFCVGFFLWFARAYNHAHGPVDGDSGLFFGYTPRPFMNTAVALLGFYFAEISMLTSAQASPVIKMLRIPAIVVIVLSWIFWFCIFIIEWIDPGSLTEDTITQIATGMLGQAPINIFLRAGYGIFLVCLIINAAVLITGVTLLTISMSKLGGERKGLLIRLVGSMMFVTLTYLVFGLVVEIGGLTNLGVGTNPDWILINAGYLKDFLLNFYVTLPSLGLLFSFRVAVGKEIEISKSATGSTSGVSSSSSSSSSSGDPVIEL